MKGRFRAAVSALVLVQACAGRNPQQADVEALRRDMAHHDARLADVELAAPRLSGEWRGVVGAFEQARESYSAARVQFEVAQRTGGEARDTFAAAAEQWQRAATLWQFYRELVLIAATMDAAALRGSAVCERTPTGSYRRQLEAQGKSLTGKDVDHIVPRSLGGADHPSNYQLLPSSVNRSQGAWWGIDKCLSVGVAICAAAVAVSVKCGSYSMLP